MDKKTKYFDLTLKRTFIFSIVLSAVLLAAGVALIVIGMTNFEEVAVTGTYGAKYTDYEWKPIISLIASGSSAIVLIPFVWFILRPILDSLTIIAMKHAKELSDEDVSTYLDHKKEK